MICLVQTARCKTSTSTPALHHCGLIAPWQRMASSTSRRCTAIPRLPGGGGGRRLAPPYPPQRHPMRFQPVSSIDEAKPLIVQLLHAAHNQDTGGCYLALWAVAADNQREALQLRDIVIEVLDRQPYISGVCTDGPIQNRCENCCGRKTWSCDGVCSSALCQWHLKHTGAVGRHEPCHQSLTPDLQAARSERVRLLLHCARVLIRPPARRGDARPPRRAEARGAPGPEVPDPVPLPGRSAPRHPRRHDAHVGKLINCWVADLRGHAVARSAAALCNRRVGSCLLQCLCFQHDTKGQPAWCRRMQGRSKQQKSCLCCGAMFPHSIEEQPAVCSDMQRRCLPCPQDHVLYRGVCVLLKRADRTADLVARLAFRGTQAEDDGRSAGEAAGGADARVPQQPAAAARRAGRRRRRQHRHVPAGMGCVDVSSRIGTRSQTRPLTEIVKLAAAAAPAGWCAGRCTTGWQPTQALLFISHH